VASLRGTEYDTGIDLEKVSKISDYFRDIREKYLKTGLLDPKVMGVDVNTLVYQVPGGMLSNLVSQLKQQNKEDKYNEVLQEVPRVREDFGYPPLVTPTSQIVGTQAVLNVIMGERYKMITKESKSLVKGEYGKTPQAISDEIRKKIIGDEPQITNRPADSIPPEIDRLRSEIKEYIERDEDVLSYALFDRVAVDFFKKRRAKLYKIEPSMVDMQNKTHPV
jgi:oxaloacetate decarboxylase alpha subunit